MHEKLSQAVRLYDKLLTEQVSHPTWRVAPAAPPVASSSTSQPDPTYNPSYQGQQPTASEYNPSYQQAPPASYNQWQPQQVTSPVQQTGQASYFASPAPVSQQQNQLNGAYAAPPATSAYYSTNMYAQSPPAIVSPQQPQAYASPVTPPGLVSRPQFNSLPPQVTGESNYIQAPPPPLVSQSPLPPGPQPSHVPPPPAQSPPHLSTLTRQNTLPPTHNPVSQYKPVQRSNTISAQSHAPQQLQQLQQTAAPPQLPVFPVVPAAPPEINGYQNAATGYAPPEERKEALLIDF